MYRILCAFLKYISRPPLPAPVPSNDSPPLHFTTILRSMHIIRDASKDKPFELEMGWLCEESNMKFALVPKALL